MRSQTQSELEKWMKENCYNFNSYSINGRTISEGFGIEDWGGLFIWYYTERGERNNLDYFQSEKEAIEYAYEKIISDKWANAHIVGYTTNKDEQGELTNILDELGISYMNDEIPYSGPGRPAYRIFVFGCDINRIKHLRDIYYKQC
ncbi:hypothetical protein [Lewinella sp. IMCC34191]|uniref:hypothetical protein n=1 Tax=Lewinella sp. IMCC34191 TaxID=2259172 RepID=UPI000E265A2B|nr:hypothetical protein [Lewinella sp. IMCC34191]